MVMTVSGHTGVTQIDEHVAQWLEDSANAG
jgi:hypothetical protein